MTEPHRPDAGQCDCETVSADTSVADLCAVAARVPHPVAVKDTDGSLLGVVPQERLIAFLGTTSAGRSPARCRRWPVPRLPLGEWVDSAVTFLQNHLSWLFDAITKVVNGMYDGIDAVLSAPHPLLFAGILAVVAWWLRGLVAGVLAFGGFALIDSIELWDEAMSTLSLVLVATVVTLVLAVPLGIWSSRSKTVSAISRPILDFMQTMPAMVYLIPGIIFFGVGVVPGIIATIVFSLPRACG